MMQEEHPILINVPKINPNPKNDLRNECQDFFSVLSFIRNKTEIALIYTNFDDTLKFSAGYICGLTKEQFVLKHISPNGIEDGLYVGSISNIIKVEYGTKYADKLKHLEKTGQFTYDFECRDDLNMDVLQHAMQKGYIVSIELENSGQNDAVGFVLAVSEKMIRILAVDEFGYNDGECYMCPDQITQITCNGIEERKIESLYHSLYD